MLEFYFIVPIGTLLLYFFIYTMTFSNSMFSAIIISTYRITIDNSKYNCFHVDINNTSYKINLQWYGQTDRMRPFRFVRNLFSCAMIYYWTIEVKLSTTYIVAVTYTQRLHSTPTKVQQSRGNLLSLFFIFIFCIGIKRVGK